MLSTGRAVQGGLSLIGFEPAIWGLVYGMALSILW